MTCASGRALLASAVLAALAATVSAQRTVQGVLDRSDPTRNIGIDQRLNGRLPLDVVLQSESGERVTLGEYFDDRPVLLALVYYECPMLCTLVLNGVLDATRVIELSPDEDYELVVVSIDPGETPVLAARKRASFLEALERPAADGGVHFLTGDQASIDALASAVGFRYVYDEQTDEFAHASGIMVATPDGRLSRYLYGVEYSARDLRLSLVEASAGTIGTFVDQVLLLCYHYDPTTGEYGFAIILAIRVLGALTVLVLAVFVLRSLRRDRAAALRRTGEVTG